MYVMVVVSLMDGECSCYRSGQFNRGKMVMLQRWLVYCRENGHVTEVVTNGGRMVTLQRWSLMEGEWSCYGGCQFNGERTVKLHRWSV